MKAVVSAAFVIRDGEVESSSVVLVRATDGVWRKFAPQTPNEFLPKSYFGLKNFMEQHKNLGWRSENLTRTGDVNSHIYLYGAQTSFWVPCWSEWILRRTWFNVYQKWDEWVMFRKVDDPASRMRTVKEFKEFIEWYPGLGWHWSFMKQDSGDPRIWQHTEGNHLDQLWFPELSNTPPSFEFAGSKGKGKLLVTCVNPLGCVTLTEGKAYELKGRRDEMFQVVDDEGQERDFLPERFKGVSS